MFFQRETQSGQNQDTAPFLTTSSFLSWVILPKVSSSCTNTKHGKELDTCPQGFFFGLLLLLFINFFFSFSSSWEPAGVNRCSLWRLPELHMLPIIPIHVAVQDSQHRNTGMDSLHRLQINVLTLAQNPRRHPVWGTGRSITSVTVC